MLIYYAVGGGLGHVSRAYKVLDALDIKPGQTKIITAHDSVPTAVGTSHDLLSVPASWAKSPSLLSKQLATWVEEFSAKRLLIDTFPMGIRGEIDQSLLPPELSFDYIARFLKWPPYLRSALGAIECSTKEGSINGFVGVQHHGLKFENIYAVEQMHPEQAAFVTGACSQTMNLKLKPLTATVVDYNLPKEYWLVVHSGPAEEVGQLIALADDMAAVEKQRPDIVICTQVDRTQLQACLSETTHLNAVRFINSYPAHPLFCAAITLRTE